MASQYIWRSGRRRWLATSSSQVLTSSPAQPPNRRFRRLLLFTSIVTAAYAGGTFASLRSEAVRDVFVERVPLGEKLVAWAEERIPPPSQPKPRAVRKATPAPHRIQSPHVDPSATPLEVSKAAARPSPPVARATAPSSQRTSEGPTDSVASPPEAPVAALVTGAVSKAADGIQELIGQAEAALGLNRTASTAAPDATPEAPNGTSNEASEAPLPLGFSPAFGVPAKREADPLALPRPKGLPAPLPALAPSIIEVSIAEPLLGHLALTIDRLTDFLRGALRLNAREDLPDPTIVLTSAHDDLLALGHRFVELKREAEERLRREMDDRTRQHSEETQQLERDLMDKLETQEQGWQKAYEEQRGEIVEEYRARLAEESRIQSELINERLREEVVAQGVELQRRWLGEVKSRVEQERGGRLARLDELRAGFESVRDVALTNSEVLDDTLQAHELWSAVKAAVDASGGDQADLSDALTALRRSAAGARAEAVQSVLSSIPARTAQHGIATTSALAAQFETTVAPRVRKAAMLPTGGGCLAYFGSALLAPLLAARHGAVATGTDVPSVLARAQHHLRLHDLDAAVRECNQLRGWPKILLRDWLKAARSALEVHQALEFAMTSATLASLQAAR